MNPYLLLELNMANSPNNSLAFRSYTLAASSGLEKLPKYIFLPLCFMAACHLAWFLYTPLYPDLFLFLGLFLIFSWWVHNLKLLRWLSKPLPFIWSISYPLGTLIRSLCNFIVNLSSSNGLKLVCAYPCERCHFQLPVNQSKSSSSTRAYLPFVSGIRFIEVL